MTKQGGADGSSGRGGVMGSEARGGAEESEHFCRAEDREARDGSSIMGGAEGLDRTSKDDGALD